MPYLGGTLFYTANLITVGHISTIDLLSMSAYLWYILSI